jgi:hypothetical protein
MVPRSRLTGLFLSTAGITLKVVIRQNGDEFILDTINLKQFVAAQSASYTK